MLFDPEDGMTTEQSIEIGWNKWAPPSMRARVLRLAELTGRTRNSIILECAKRPRMDLTHCLKVGRTYELQGAARW